MILLWDSSTMNVKLILIDAETRYEYEWEAGRSLARDMLAYLRDRLAEHDGTFESIEAIGVFRGPGSFTGLRIGLTVLNTFADSLRLPIVGAVGAKWETEVLARIAKGEADSHVMPEYGGDAPITKPRK